MTFVFILALITILIGVGTIIWGFASGSPGGVVGGFLLAILVGNGRPCVRFKGHAEYDGQRNHITSAGEWFA